jgi:hypothetical protein
MEEKYQGKTDDECLVIFRQEVSQNNTDHPTAKPCIAYDCQNKIETDQWDNQVLCEEHDLLIRYWGYELGGFNYNPEIFDFPTGKKLPKPKGSDANMTAYRKRYCDWIAGLSKEEYRRILLWNIR